MNFTQALLCSVGLHFMMATAAHTADTPNTLNAPKKKSEAIPWSQIGVKASSDYHGDGLFVAATATGAQLHCVFQRMDGEATGEGLWLVSTVTNRPGDRFRVMATAVGGRELATQGTVTVAGQTVRFSREGLVEEYSVSMDGVRQDFVVKEKPAGDGQLTLRLAVSGARVERAPYGAQLLLEKSGRKITYSRLHATDANGKELSARIEAEPNSEMPLTVVVTDAGAVYPVRIDPTFSDANWLTLGAGMNGPVYALAVSSSTLYAGGDFTVADGTNANHIAQWNGSSWSPLGAGINGTVSALAVSGGTLYAGGQFSRAGRAAINGIAQWNGTSWSSFGDGMTAFNGPPQVAALAVSGVTLYVGGYFDSAGTNVVSGIAQWNGSSWSPLGLGMDYGVAALAVSGGNLYAGGSFEGVENSDYSWVTVNHIAQWNGSTWSPLGSGIGGGSYPSVHALAVSGGTLYVGGVFTAAGGTNANCIAQWDGSSWSPLGSGVDSYVFALAASGGTLYAGGSFVTAGTNEAIRIAEAIINTNTPVAPPFIVTTDGMLGFNNRQFRFTLTGPVGSNVVVQVSTNFLSWSPLVTNPITSGTLNFTDTLATNYLRRFYRAKLE